MTYIYTIEQSNCFWHWLQSSSSYKNNFSYDGAKIVFEYIEQLAEESNMPIVFDPIAWCGLYQEYESFEKLQEDYKDIESLDELLDHTTVLSYYPLITLAF